MSEALIVLDAVSKTFRRRKGSIHALREVSFTVNRGDVFGLLGANGAGKTTAMRGILGLTRLDSGAITVFGRRRSDRRSLFGRAAYLPEEPQLFQGATGREHLHYFGRLCDLRGQRLRARTDEVLGIVGLANDADRPIRTYSKGMKQRLGIAAAILHEPDILFMDEPTRGLDPIGGREVRDLLQILSKNGVTLFLNSHLLGEVERLCNRVVILDHGTVRADGLLSELLTDSPRLRVRFTLPPEVAAPEGALWKGAAWEADVADTAALAEIVATVARAGGQVIEAQTARLELEEYFIRVVREGAAK